MQIINNEKRLRAGAYFHFLLAAGHLACLPVLEQAFDAYGIREAMTRMAFGHMWVLYALTVALAIAFALVGIYAYSAMGHIRRLPFTRLVCIAVVAIYTLRTVLGLASCATHFAWLQFISSVIPALLAYCYWPGTKKEEDQVQFEIL
ncbi:MAG: hypothetical protein Q4B68_03695 [Bacteroidales bacterium]|nr:hypothetical protein [Bacteroidales bacterium]